MYVKFLGYDGNEQIKNVHVGVTYLFNVLRYLLDLINSQIT